MDTGKAVFTFPCGSITCNGKAAGIHMSNSQGMVQGTETSILQLPKLIFVKKMQNNEETLMIC